MRSIWPSLEYPVLLKDSFAVNEGRLEDFLPSVNTNPDPTAFNGLSSLERRLL